jgi:hypothetical protein
MKKAIASLAIIVASATFSYAQEIKFETTTINYGKIEKGSDGVRIFKFTNVGNAPLIIQNAVGSCGCTVPTYSKEPILPGQSSEISVRYDTQREGMFTKNVTVTTNSIKGDTERLVITGEVFSKNTNQVPTNFEGFTK